MITYREATSDDAEKIALLHARSWQLHYKNIWPDEFLAHQVEENRLEVWKKRLQAPDANQYVIVAEDDDVLCGFACVFDNHDPIWGALLDNLHVVPFRQSKGIGAELMKMAARWVYNRNPDANFHLYVLEKNSRAIQFYERSGGTNIKLVSVENPGGGFSDAFLYGWADLKKMI